MASAAVREPTKEEVDGFNTLADVFEWARIRGGLACPGSRAGSLLRLLAQHDWFQTDIADVANVAVEDFDHIIGNWLYCGGDIDAEAEGAEFMPETMEETPGPILLGAARAFHQACKIQCKLVWSRDDIEAHAARMHQQRDDWVASNAASSSQAWEPIILHAPVAPVSQTVNIGTLMDTGKSQEVPLLHEDVFWRGIENWRRTEGHGVDDPDPAIRPSLQQYTAWLAVVALGSIYVDFSLCAPWDIRTQRSRRWKGLFLGADNKWREEMPRTSGFRLLGAMFPPVGLHVHYGGDLASTAYIHLLQDGPNSLAQTL